MGLPEVVVEGDSRSIIQKLVSQTADLSSVRSIISDARQLASNFRHCRFTFVGRTGNEAAHAMAIEGRTGLVDCFWVEDGPPSVLAVAASDRRFGEPP
ncbi:hypothetical protein HRI_003856900 [Hibiscus trionum]|nr:hypothetical protein HRI_003856900 [Hibiscus trionum]